MNKLIFAFILLSLSGCKVHKQDEVKHSDFKSETEYSFGGVVTNSLVTIEHDKHTFITWKGGHQMNLLHHPDCPCLFKK